MQTSGIVLLVLGTALFVRELLEKGGFFRFLASRAQRAPKKWMYTLLSGLSDCRFCQVFHISVAICAVLCLFVGFSYDLCLLPAVSAGLSTLNRQK